MAEFLVVVMLVLSIVVGMALAFGRMITIRDSDRSRVEPDLDPFPASVPYEEMTRGDDGLSYGRAMSFDPGLASADNRAKELPDVNQTLQGKR